MSTKNKIIKLEDHIDSEYGKRGKKKREEFERGYETFKQKLSEKFGGKLNLSEKEYNEFQQHLKDARNEWERNF